MSGINFLHWLEGLYGIKLFGLGGAIKGLANGIARLLYGAYFGIVKIIALVLDLLTQLFFIFSGMTPIGTQSVNENGEAGSIDIVNYFLTQPAFEKAYIWLCGVALGLVVIFTIAKIIKQDYFERSGPRSKGPIFRNVALSFIAFICVIPIFYFLIDVVAALATVVMKAMGYKGGGIGTMLFNMCWDDNGSSIYNMASSIYFERTTVTINDLTVTIPFGLDKGYPPDQDNFGWYSSRTFYAYYWNEAEGMDYKTLAGEGVGSAGHIAEFYWYIFLLTGLVLITNLAKMMVAMVTRLYKLIALFIVAPSPISQIVLDDGAKFKEWKDKLIQEAMKVVGCVMCFMVFMLVASAINDLDLMMFAYTDKAASAKNLLESNNMTSELSNSITTLYYGGDKVTWVDSLINALGKAMLLVAGVGAIQDMDNVITPLLAGGSSSMDTGATGKAITTAAGAAASGALGLAKVGVSGATKIAGATVRGVAGLGSAAASAIQSKQGRKLSKEEQELKGKEEAAKQESAKVKGEDKATPEAGKGQGGNKEEKAKTPTKGAGETSRKILDKDEKKEKREKAKKNGGKIDGGKLKNFGRGVGRVASAIGKTGLSAVKGVGGVALTAAKTGFSAASIVAKTTLKATGMGNIASGIDQIDKTVRETATDVVDSVKKTGDGIKGDYKKSSDMKANNLKRAKDLDERVENLEKGDEGKSVTGELQSPDGASNEFDTEGMRESNEAEDNATTILNTAEKLGNNSEAANELKAPRKEVVQKAIIENNAAKIKSYAAHQKLDESSKKLDAASAKRDGLQVKKDEAKALKSNLDAAIRKEKIAIKSGDQEKIKAAQENRAKAQEAYDNSSDVKDVQAEGFENALAEAQREYEQAEQVYNKDKFDADTADIEQAETQENEEKALSMEATTVADKHFKARCDYVAADKSGDPAKIAEAKKAFDDTKKELRKFNAIVDAENRVLAAGRPAPTSEPQQSAPEKEVEYEVTVKQGPQKAAERAPKPLGETLSNLSQNGHKGRASMRIIKAFDEGRIDADIGEVALQTFGTRGADYSSDKYGSAVNGLRNLEVNQDELSSLLNEITKAPQGKDLAGYRDGLNTKYNNALNGYNSAINRAKTSLREFKSSGNAIDLEEVKQAISEAISHNTDMNDVLIEMGKKK